MFNLKLTIVSLISACAFLCLSIVLLNKSNYIGFFLCLCVICGILSLMLLLSVLLEVIKQKIRLLTHEIESKSRSL